MTAILIIPLDERRGLRLGFVQGGVLASVYLLKKDGRWIQGVERMYATRHEAETTARRAFARAAARRVGAPADDRIWDVEDP